MEITKLSQAKPSVTLGKAPMFQGRPNTSLNPSTPRFGSQDKRTGGGGVFSLFKRAFNYVLAVLHFKVDQAEEANPIPALRAERAEMRQRFDQAADRLRTIVAEYNVSLKGLEGLAQAELKEKGEAVDAGRALKELKADAPEYTESAEYARLQMQEYQDAKAKRESYEASLKEKELNAQEAQDTLETLKEGMSEKDREIQQAEQQWGQSEAYKEVAETRRDLDELKGATSGLGSRATELMKKIAVDFEKNKMAAAGDKSKEARVAELRAKQLGKERKAQETLASLDQLLAEEENTGKTTTQKTETTSASGGNPVDEAFPTEKK